MMIMDARLNENLKLWMPNINALPLQYEEVEDYKSEDSQQNNASSDLSDKQIVSQEIACNNHIEDKESEDCDESIDDTMLIDNDQINQPDELVN